MHDKDISIRSLIAVSLWTIAVILGVVDLGGWLDIGDLGVVFGLAGATLHIRGFFLCQTYREQKAFDIGRAYERESDVPSLS